MEVVVRFGRVLWLVGVLVVFTWWSWLWHRKCEWLRGRCDFLLATLRDLHAVDGCYPDELLERWDDLVEFGWGSPR